MSEVIAFTIDGVEVKAKAGQTIMEAAEAADGQSIHAYRAKRA